MLRPTSLSGAESDDDEELWLVLPPLDDEPLEDEPPPELLELLERLPPP